MKFIFFFTVLSCLLLSSCGEYGQLYLPNQEKPNKHLMKVAPPTQNQLINPQIGY